VIQRPLPLSRVGRSASANRLNRFIPVRRNYSGLYVCIAKLLHDFITVNGATNKKRKRTSKTDDEEDGEETERAARSGVESGPEDDDDEEADDADDDDDEGFKAPVKSRRKSIASAKAPRRSAPAAKKPRTARASVAGVTSSTAAPKRAGRPRKNKAADHSTSAGVAANAAQDSKISSDNHLFSTLPYVFIYLFSAEPVTGFVYL
jgi:hypothetical protein